MDEVLGKHRPPQSFDAEKGILCSIFIDPDAMEAVRGETLIPKDFHHPHHQSIYEAMLALYDKNEPIDTVTVANYLMVTGKLEQIGANTLSVIEEFLPTSAAVLSYVRLVKGKSALRRLISAAKTITEKAYSQSQDVNEVIDEAEQTILAIRDSTAKRGIISLKELSHIAVEKYLALIENKMPVTGVGSGFSDLDKFTAGFQPGELIIIAARPSMGKTAFSLNIAENVALDTKLPVAVFSMEMGATQLATRMIGSVGRLDQHRMRNGNLEDEDWVRLTTALGKLNDAPIFIDEGAGLSSFDVRARARRLHRQCGKLGLIVVDYLQLMSAPSGRQGENRATEISEISRSLKSLAKELDVPVVALSQLNRSVEQRPDKRPVMSDLRESGAIEQDADLILFIYRDEVYNPDTQDKGTAEIIIAKQRNGPIGRVRLTFLGQHTRFENFAGGGHTADDY
ncbi:MAG: replicative DNA helicase [Pseudomonadota bacterium]